MNWKPEQKIRSRTEYSTINASISLISKVVMILMGFATRVVFTHTLSSSYVGVNGLFGDILNVLSLTELGVETAISFAMYRPIAEKDVWRQRVLIRMFRNFYRITACAIAVFGVALIPFLDVLMKQKPQVDHLLLLYLLYLTNSVLSYFLVYKRTIIEVHQQNYIVMFYQMLFVILQDVLQILVLVVTHNFVLFLLIYLCCTCLLNVAISRKADQLYPYLQKPCEDHLPKDEKKVIFQNIRAMMMHKIGNVVVNNTDNLLISAFVGVTTVGIYSNYYLVIGSVRQVLDQMFQGITASVGNLGVTEKNAKIKDVFETTFFVGQWLYGFAAICLYELLNPFIGLAFGKEYLFSGNIVLMLCINFFVTGTRKAALTFRDSMGLFWFDRYKSVVEAVCNLFLSIFLVQKAGTFGVFFGTLLASLGTSVWIEPFVLYHQKLKTPVLPFYLHYLGYGMMVAGTWWMTSVLCRLVGGGLLVQLIGRLFICVAVPNGIWMICYHRTQEWKNVTGRLREMWTKNR